MLLTTTMTEGQGNDPAPNTARSIMSTVTAVNCCCPADYLHVMHPTPTTYSARQAISWHKSRTLTASLACTVKLDCYACSRQSLLLQSRGCRCPATAGKPTCLSEGREQEIEVSALTPAQGCKMSDLSLTDLHYVCQCPFHHTPVCCSMSGLCASWSPGSMCHSLSAGSVCVEKA